MDEFTTTRRSVLTGWAPERRSRAEGVLPPSNTGHLTAGEFATFLATGEQPDRLTDQLDMYVDFEFKHLPLFREEVEAVAETRETLVAGPSTGGEVPASTTDGRFDAADLPLAGETTAEDADGVSGSH